ncbi:MAG: NAD(P)-dependent alcohol dehydrogenase [Actinomycetota bacterium]|nr:NAD(P)-dependent alcohol dehydrogenase [Actinomycetota bacterium]
MDVAAYAAPAAKAPLGPTTISRRDVGPHDVLIEIAYSGICHSDIHQGREEWGSAIFPMVPGHEIAGIITEVGSAVTGFKIGDHAGIGCFVDSCRQCERCKAGDEQYCSVHTVLTYNSIERDGKTPTYGGYSTHIVCDEAYVLRIPENLPLDASAPLLCAGITLYDPLKRWKVGPGTRIGVMGLGGLGHMGVKLAVAMGAEVTVVSHSPGKEEDALRLGAHAFLLSSDRAAMKSARNSLHLIANTVAADIDLNPYLSLLDLDGVMALVGLPESALAIRPFTLIGGRRALAGSSIGGIAATQEMLDFCGQHDVTSDIETIAVQQVNEAWDRVVSSDVKYRFVIDTASLTD